MKTKKTAIAVCGKYTHHGSATRARGRRYSPPTLEELQRATDTFHRFNMTMGHGTDVPSRNDETIAHLASSAASAAVQVAIAHAQFFPEAV